MYYVSLRNWSQFDSAGVPRSSGYGLVDDPMNERDESLFTNLQSYVYWSGTAYALDPVSLAWGFGTYNGGQNVYSQEYKFYAWAVRDGDVAAATGSNDVPEPSSMMLLGLALAGLGVARHRKAI